MRVGAQSGGRNSSGMSGSSRIARSSASASRICRVTTGTSSSSLPASARALAGSDDDDVPVVTRQILLADALERAMRDDPLIPLELRPPDWAPTRIRRRWLDAWEGLAARLPEQVIYRGWLSP